MWKKIIYTTIILILIVFTAIRLKKNKEISQERVYRYEKEKPISVQTIILKKEPLGNDYSYSGTFEPNKETKISSDIQGKVNAVLVESGSVVHKGQTLIRLDNSLLKLQLQNIEVQIEGLEADVKRYTVLAKADAIQGIQLEKAELGLKSARIQRATLMEQIDKTEIRSPFNGIVTAKLTEEGAFAAPGVPLMQITDISTLKFTLNVPENKVIQFNDSKEGQVTADVYPNFTLPAKVSMVGSKANTGNSYPVQFVVSNTPDLKIKSGMFGKVRIITDTEEGEQIIIPASAVVGTNIQPQVYIVKSGQAILQDVIISKRTGNKLIISNGLNEGDEIVTNGFINLFDGARVNIK